MARILGEAGRYVSHQATNLRNRMWNKAAVGIGVLGWIAGFAMSCSLPRVTLSIWGSAPAVLISVIAMVVWAKWCFRCLDDLEQEREHWRKGTAGEAAVGLRLEQFPEEFRVVNDLDTPFGNIDHVVVGPTGVFVIDTKNWRGTVSADGKGELTLNGEALSKPYVRRFIARVMDVKEKVQLLAPGLDPFFQSVFVFTSACVQANFGTTSALHCVRDEQLYDYIVNKRFGKKLSPVEVEKIAQAFHALADMDQAFAESNEPLRKSGKPTPQSLLLVRPRAERRELAEARA